MIDVGQWVRFEWNGAILEGRVYAVDTVLRTAYIETDDGRLYVNVMESRIYPHHQRGYVWSCVRRRMQAAKNGRPL